MIPWIRAGMAILAAALWLVNINVWIDLNRRMPAQPDEAHPYAYGGHHGPFYVNAGDLWLLRFLDFGPLVLIIGAGFVGRDRH